MQYMYVLAQVVDQASDKPDPWWTVMAGIIAVPAAVLGLFYTAALIRKTRLESRKMELEISEEKADVEKAETNQDGRNLTQIVAGPLIEGRRVQEIILRFVVLYLVLQAWSIVRQLFSIVQIGFPLGLVDAVLNDRAGGLEIAVFVASLVLQEIPSIGYYVVLFGLGIPILADALRHLNIKEPPILALLQTKQALIALGLIVLFSGVVPGLMVILQ